MWQVWHDRVVFRNHNSEMTEVTVPRLSDLYCPPETVPDPQPQGRGGCSGGDAGDEELVYVREVRYGEEGGESDRSERCTLSVSGSSLEIFSGRMYVVRAVRGGGDQVGAGGRGGVSNAHVVETMSCHDLTRRGGGVPGQGGVDAGGDRGKRGSDAERASLANEQCQSRLVKVGPLQLEVEAGAGGGKGETQRVDIEMEEGEACGTGQTSLTCRFEDSNGTLLGESPVGRRTVGGGAGAQRGGGREQGQAGVVEDPLEWVTEADAARAAGGAAGAPWEHPRAASTHEAQGAHHGAEGAQHGGWECVVPGVRDAGIVKVSVWRGSSLPTRLLVAGRYTAALSQVLCCRMSSSVSRRHEAPLSPRGGGVGRYSITLSAWLMI